MPTIFILCKLTRTSDPKLSPTRGLGDAIKDSREISTLRYFSRLRVQPQWVITVWIAKREKKSRLFLFLFLNYEYLCEKIEDTMGILDLFRKRKKEADGNIKPQQHTTQQPTQYQRALQFNTEFSELLSGNSFIARSDYKHFISEYQEEYKFFCSIVEANILENYVSINNLDIARIKSFITLYKEIQELLLLQ